MNNDDILLVFIKPLFHLGTDCLDELKFWWRLVHKSMEENAIIEYFWRVRLLNESLNATGMEINVNFVNTLSFDNLYYRLMTR